MVRDAPRAASQLITASGGTVTASGADGTTYALDVPAGALSDDETITLTPITKVGGFAVGKGIVAGVHAEPSGLHLLNPATLTITLPQAPAERLIGFQYEGDGTEFGGALVVGTGATARLRVTEFSGFGAGTESSPELRAILARPSAAASQRFADEFLALSAQGVRDQAAYLDVLRRWYRQVVRPGLTGAVGSDPRLRQALRDYNQWLIAVQQGSLVLGLAADLDTPMRPEQAEALGLVATALRDAVARADARCLAQHSLAEAETALEWQVIADAADVDTPANALDLDTVLDGLCVEAHYDDVTFPAPPPPGIQSVLRVRVGLAFIDGVPATGDTMDVEVDPHGTVELITIGGDTDANGVAEFDYTPLGDRELRLDIHSCGHVPGRRRLKRVCQDAFVVRGLDVTPPSVTLAPGGTQQFQATLFGQPVTVTWSTTTGSIDQTGLLTAGTAPGTFEVRATNPVDGRSTAASVTIPGTTTTTVPVPPGLEGLWVGRYTVTFPGGIPPTHGCGAMSVSAQPTGGLRLLVCTDDWCGVITHFADCAPVFDVSASGSSFSGLMVNHTGQCCRGCPGQERGWENGCQITGGLTTPAGGTPHLTASFDTSVSSCFPAGGVTTSLDLEKTTAVARCGDCLVTGTEECEPPGTSTCQADCRRPPPPPD